MDPKIALTRDYSQKPMTNKKKKTAELEYKEQSTNTQFLQPVIIVAGNGIARLPTDHKKYQTLMQEGFRDFTGTIISGGTNTGVSSIAGKIAKKYKITAIGYIPNLKQVPNIEINNNYIIKNTDGNDFSPLEPLQYWLDIIASGIEPAQVKLLGIGGGQISAVEYRIALALGAIVAIVDESRGEAAKLFFRW